MEVTINDIVHQVPFDLNIITLGEFLEYQEQYGRALDEQLHEILEKQYEGDPDDMELMRTFDLERHLDNEGLAWFSFWTKHDLFEVKDVPFVAPVLDNFRFFRNMLKDQTLESQSYPLEIEFEDEQWEINDFVITPANSMTFNEIITSKEVMRQTYAIGRGKWDALPYLCAIFLRKKGELFSDDMIEEDGERLKIINRLPLMHALQVAFFLSSCVISWSKTSLFLAEREEELQSPSL